MPLVEQSRRSRTHYQGLDFLRGVAAIGVVMFHFSSRLDLFGLLNHGYLAVDFFFALSGFVIDRAYGERLTSGELSFKVFFFLRIVRLLPLVIGGTLLAAATDLFRHTEFSMAQHVVDIVVTGIMSCLCLPTLWETTLEQTTFPLNGPVWSLSFELVANFCCVPIFRAKHCDTLFIAVALLSLVMLTWALLDGHDVHFGTHRSTFLLGFPRVFWSYSLGVLLSRAEIRVPPMSKWVYAAVLSCVLACPALPGHLNALFDLIVICVIVPLIVVGAAHCTGAQRHSPLSKWSGDMSYPLYAIHYPLVRGISAISRQFIQPSVPINLLIAIAATTLFVFLASSVFTLYDVPVRRWLNRRLRRQGGHCEA